MIMRALLVTLLALAGVARADDSTPPAAAWQPRCETAVRKAKDALARLDATIEPQIAAGVFAPPDSEGEAPMVKLEYFVSHGLAITLYVWQLEHAGKARGWRDIDPFHLDTGMREERERGRLHAQILVGNSTRKDVKAIRAILAKAADACLK